MPHQRNGWRAQLVSQFHEPISSIELVGSDYTYHDLIRQLSNSLLLEQLIASNTRKLVITRITRTPSETD